MVGYVCEWAVGRMNIKAIHCMCVLLLLIVGLDTRTFARKMVPSDTNSTNSSPHNPQLSDTPTTTSTSHVLSPTISSTNYSTSTSHVLSPTIPSINYNTNTSSGDNRSGTPRNDNMDKGTIPEYAVISGAVVLSALSAVGSFAVVRKIRMKRHRRGNLIFIDNSIDRHYTFRPD